MRSPRVMRRGSSPGAGPGRPAAGDNWLPCRSAAAATAGPLRAQAVAGSGLASGYRCGDRRRISASIQASVRVLISSCVSPAVSMAGPMLITTCPGRLMKALRGQHSPALCATGTTLAPVCAAR